MNIGWVAGEMSLLLFRSPCRRSDRNTLGSAALNLRCLERNMAHRSHNDGEERRIEAIEGGRIARSHLRAVDRHFKPTVYVCGEGNLRVAVSRNTNTYIMNKMRPFPKIPIGVLVVYPD
jgi:hypothetical protein